MTRSSQLYKRIYTIVKTIPPGKVMTYGQIAGIVGSCSARNVGYAMSSLPFDTDVPWQRVINAKGEVSKRTDGYGHLVQRQILETEGVVFSENGKVNLAQYRWKVSGKTNFA